MSLSAAQQDFYGQNGYLVVKNAISDAGLATLRSVIQTFRDEAAKIRSSNAIFDVADEHSPATPKLRRIKHPVDRHPSFDALMRSETIVDRVVPLLGARCGLTIPSSISNPKAALRGSPGTSTGRVYPPFE